MQPFANRVALVTGAGSGLGRQLALDLARAGAAVAALDLKPEPLASLEAELGGKPFAWAVADVCDRLALREAVLRLGERLGPIDLLIASAGLGSETSALSFQAADVEALVRVNLIGVANSIEAVLPGMLDRRRGQLVAISSLASYRGFPRLLGYSASKAGVNALLDGLRAELRPHGITVTTICPGWIRTPMTANLEIPPRQIMEPAVAAERILRAIGRRRAFYAFPRPAAWRLGLLRWLPCRASDWLAVQALREIGKKDTPVETPPANQSAPLAGPNR